jgi:hypothetical protein
MGLWSFEESDCFEIQPKQRSQDGLPTSRIIVATIVFTIALPLLLLDVFWDDTNRKDASHCEMRAAQSLEYATYDPRNAAAHLELHQEYKQYAQEYRVAIGWGRWRSPPLIGLGVGFLAWQFRLRWLAALCAIGVVAAVLLASMAMSSVPLYALVGAVILAFLGIFVLSVFVVGVCSMAGVFRSGKGATTPPTGLM